LSATAHFTSYSQEKFQFAEQQRLAQVCRDVAAEGGFVLISNHDTPEVRGLYAGADIHSFALYRPIGCKSELRKPVQELLALFRPA